MNGIRSQEPKKDDKNLIFTKETFGVVLILFATLMLICLITRDAIFSLPGRYVNAFLFGILGYAAYPVVIGIIVLGVLMVSGKKISLVGKRKALGVLSFVLAVFIVHTITMHGDVSLSYGAYLSKAYNMGAGGILTSSGGGIINAIVCYLFAKLLTSIGCYVVFGVLLVVMCYFIVKSYLGNKSVKAQQGSFRSTYVKEPEIVDALTEGELPSIDYPVGNIDTTTERNDIRQKLFVNNPSDFYFKTKKDVKKDDDSSGMKIEFASGGLGVVTTGAHYSEAYDEEMKQKIDYIKTPAEINIESALNGSKYSGTQSLSVSKPIFNQTSSDNLKSETESDEIPMFEHVGEYETTADDSAKSRAEDFATRFASTPDFEDREMDSEPMSIEEIGGDRFDGEVFDYTYDDANTDRNKIETGKSEEKDFNPFSRRRADAIGDTYFDEQTNSDENFDKSENKSDRTENFDGISRSERSRGLIFNDENTDSPAFTSRVKADDNFSSRRTVFSDPQQADQATVDEQEMPVKEIPPINREYFRPPLDLLETYTVPVGMPTENHEERKEIIQRTLEEFHINAIPQSHVQGPSITRYEIMMPSGISVKRVLNYADDLKMRLSSKEEVRIEAPIPGKNLVGIEVANKYKVTVGLKEVLEGMSNQDIKPNALQFVLGKDLVGKSISDNLAKGPHYLIAGATGSGKSVCLNIMLVSLIMRYSPEELRIILVDPKQVEFRPYEHLPHLMIDEIITDPKKTLAMLSWAQQEMERRYGVFRSCKEMIVDIDAYNSTIASDTVPKMPRIIIVIDELADLMESCKKDLEARIQAIAQKARSAGIHLVLATQRPSVNIITGTIKANLPSRIAFKVMNFTDSQTILGEQGAEKLLGNGDMLYKNSTMPTVERYQGAYISSREVNNITSYIKENNKAYFDDDLAEFLEKATAASPDPTLSQNGVDSDSGDENDEFFLKVLAYAVNAGTVSISQLQRRFQIGWSRAGGLVDKMERMKFITGNIGTKGRKVLLTREGFEQRFGPMPDDSY